MTPRAFEMAQWVKKTFVVYEDLSSDHHNPDGML